MRKVRESCEKVMRKLSESQNYGQNDGQKQAKMGKNGKDTWENGQKRATMGKNGQNPTKTYKTGKNCHMHPKPLKNSQK